MASIQPIMASEATAAKLLELSAGQFKQLVDTGVLPRGREICRGIVRWDVEELRRIARGDMAECMSDVDWSK